MTTDQLYQQYEGTSIPSFDGNPANNGQCEQWYLMVRTKRDGLGVVSGNAIDRWYDQEPEYLYISFATGIYPRKDDYVVWGTGVGSQYGHIDVCAQDGNAGGFVGYDSNWGGSKILQTINHNYNFGILGYVRFKGGTMDKITKDQENSCAVMQTYSYPGKDYNYKFTGLPLTQANLDAMLQFWSSQPRPNPPEFVEAPQLYIKQ